MIASNIFKWIGTLFTEYLFTPFNEIRFHAFSTTEFTLLFIVEKIVFFIIFTLLFFGVNFIISKNKLTLDNSYALLFYLLVISFFSTYLYDYKVVLEYIIHLLFLRKVYSLQTLNEVFKKLFDAGFWLGGTVPYEPVFNCIFSTSIHWVNRS